jgi:hypothetical protein
MSATARSATVTSGVTGGLRKNSKQAKETNSGPTRRQPAAGANFSVLAQINIIFYGRAGFTGEHKKSIPRENSLNRAAALHGFAPSW